jgi:hypothetical protein
MSWSRTFQEDIVYYFREFCEKFYWDESSGLTYTSLDEFMNEWLHSSTEKVLQLTGNDPNTWHEAVLIVIDAYGKDPSILNFKGDKEQGNPPQERRVERILDFEEWGAPFLDRRIYRQLAAGLE